VKRKKKKKKKKRGWGGMISVEKTVFGFVATGKTKD
jgi:hypothetical protein